MQLLGFQLELARGQTGSFSICSYPNNLFALFDQENREIVVLNKNGEATRKIAVDMPSIDLGSSQRVAGPHQAKKTPACIASDAAGNFYTYATLDDRVRAYDQNGILRHQFVAKFPVEDILVEDSTLLLPGYRNNFRLHRFSVDGTVLRSWGRDIPNSLSSDFDPSPHPLIRTAKGNYFFRKSEALGVIDKLDGGLKLDKRLIREYSSCRTRAVTQVAIVRPNVATVSLYLRGASRRIHSLVPFGEDGCGLVISDYYARRTLFECYSPDFRLERVYVLPSIGALHSCIRLGSGDLIFLTVEGKIFHAREEELKPVDPRDHLRSIQSSPAHILDNVNAPSGPYLDETSIAKLRKNWSRVTKGLVVVGSALLADCGTVSELGAVSFSSWERIPKTRERLLRKELSRLLGTLRFYRGTAGEDATNRVQIVISLYDKVETLRRASGRTVTL